MLLWAWFAPNCAAILKQWVLYLYANSKEEIDARWLSLKSNVLRTRSQCFQRTGAGFSWPYRWSRGDKETSIILPCSPNRWVLSYSSSEIHLGHLVILWLFQCSRCVFFFLNVFLSRKKNHNLSFLSSEVIKMMSVTWRQATGRWPRY